jgi:hypothetical protein
MPRILAPGINSREDRYMPDIRYNQILRYWSGIVILDISSYNAGGLAAAKASVSRVREENRDANGVHLIMGCSLYL